MKKILAIDGGGIRGIIPAQVLAYVERHTGKRVNELFDYIVGTSTGGMLSLALSRKTALAASAMCGVYRMYGPQIFEHHWRHVISSVGNLNGPKYSDDALYQCARACLGTDKMSDAACHTMVTCYDLKARAPLFISDYNTPDVAMVDAALSTSAAPTYFPPHGNMIDGGVCDNNPALSGVIEACKIYDCTVRECLVLSLGTGSDMVAMDGKQAGTWGLLTWAQKLPSIFMDGTSGLHEYHLRRLLPDANVLRLQTPVTGTQAEMDCASVANLDALERTGAQIVFDKHKELDAFLERLTA